jgi:hypothetical protein
MIRKNAVESILAERDILITVRNPFVVCQLVEIRFVTIFLSLTLYTKHFVFDLLPVFDRCASFIHLHLEKTCTL